MTARCGWADMSLLLLFGGASNAPVAPGAQLGRPPYVLTVTSPGNAMTVTSPGNTLTVTSPGNSLEFED